MSRKGNLRQWCIDEYGTEFGMLYDKLNSGDAVGGLLYTISIVEMIEEVKKKHTHKNIFQRLKERSANNGK
jgi:hypothetical protein